MEQILKDKPKKVKKFLRVCKQQESLMFCVLLLNILLDKMFNFRAAIAKSVKRRVRDQAVADFGFYSQFRFAAVGSPRVTHLRVTCICSLVGDKNLLHCFSN